MPPATVFAGLSAGDSPAPPFLARGGPAYSWRMPGWSSKLTRPVVIKGGPLLRTLGDVRAFMIAEARMPEARMPRIAIIKPACSALLILLSISAVPQEAARADAASGQLLFNNACRTCHTMKEGDNRLPAKIPALRFATPYPRVSNDTPSENAFCCVAPGVRFSDFAILATGVFWRASVFNSRTSSLVHSRRFAFFAIFTGSNVLGAAS